MNAAQIRALADSGTPGLLRTSTWTAYDLPMLRSVTEDVWVGELRDSADATKIVAAVNALPKVADLVEAIEDAGHREGGLRTAGYCVECSEGWPCPTIRARDALVAALGVTE